jgi:hypothetical protein
MQLYTTINSGPKPHPLDITFPEGISFAEARKATIELLKATEWACTTLTSTSGKQWHVSKTGTCHLKK